MPNAHDYSYNVEIGVRANTSDVKRAKKTLRSVAEIFDEIHMEEKLSQETKAVEAAAQKAARSVRRLNNVMDVARKIARDYSEASNYDELLKASGELADIRDDELEQYKKLAEAIKGSREEREHYKEIEKEINEAAKDAAKEIEYQEQRRIERLEVIKGSFGAIGGALANVLQLGDVWSETLSTTKKITEGIDKFLFGSLKKKLNDKISASKKEKAVESAKLKELAELEKKGIKEAYKLRKKMAKEHRKDYAKEAEEGDAAGGGGGGGGVSSMLGGLGGGGAGGSTKMLKGIKAAMIGIQVAIGSVVGVFKLLMKVLTLSSDVLEEFHTITYSATGGAEALGLTVANLTMKHDFLIEEIKDATKALVHQGLAISDSNDNFEEMVIQVASFNRVTGISQDKLARFIKVQQVQGEYMSNTQIALGHLTETMRKYSLTADEATTILEYATDQSYRMNITFGHVEKGGAKLIETLGAIGAAAKQMGLDMSEATRLFDMLSQDMTKLIVATQGMSLQGPLKGLESLVMNIDNIVDTLPDDPFARDIVLKNVYGLDEKQLNLVQKMNSDFEDWKQEQKTIAKENRRFIDESELTFERWKKASKEAEATAGNIERMAQESNNNIQRSMQLLRDKVMAAFMKIGVSLMPAFVKMAKILLQVVSAGMEMLFGESVDFSSAFEGIEKASAMSYKIAEEQKDIEALNARKQEYNDKVQEVNRKLQEGTLKASSEEAKVLEKSLMAEKEKLKADEDALKQKNYTAIAEKKLADENQKGIQKLKPAGWLADIKDAFMAAAEAMMMLVDVLKTIHNIGQNVKKNTSSWDAYWSQFKDTWSGAGGSWQINQDKTDYTKTSPEVEAEIARINAEKAKAKEAKAGPTKTEGQVGAYTMISEGSKDGGTNVTVNTDQSEVVKELKGLTEAQLEQIEQTRRVANRIGRNNRSSNGRTSAQSWD